MAGRGKRSPISLWMLVRIIKVYSFFFRRKCSYPHSFCPLPPCCHGLTLAEFPAKRTVCKGAHYKVCWHNLIDKTQRKCCQLLHSFHIPISVVLSCLKQLIWAVIGQLILMSVVQSAPQEGKAYQDMSGKAYKDMSGKVLARCRRKGFNAGSNILRPSQGKPLSSPEPWNMWGRP